MKPTTGNHFEATYEHPWGGVASDAYKTDIAPNQMEVCDGIIIKNGVLNAASFDSLGYDTSAIVGEITFAFNAPAGGNEPYLLDSLGNIYIMLFNAKVVSLLVTNAACISAFAYKLINGKVYIFSKQAGASFLFDPDANTFTLNSAYVGGDYATVVDQYLVTANTDQSSDTPPEKKNRVNWSSPDGFAIWDPAVDRSAGFNVLADVSDEITGLFTMGNVAFILRGQGLTQMTPTGIGIQPFDFTPLWTSDIGLGCLYPFTFAQYGPYCIWGNDSGFYLFTGGAPTEICKQAKAAIFRDMIDISSGELIINENVQAAIYNSAATDSGSAVVTPDLRYTMCISQAATDSQLITLVFWTYTFNTGVWTRTTKTISSANNLVVAIGSINTVYYPKSSDGGSRQIPLYILSYRDNGVLTTKIYSLFEASIRYPANSPAAIPISINFKAEEVKLARQPNVRGVIVKAKGKAGGPQTLHITVQNETASVAFTDIIVLDEKVRTYKSNGMFTNESPQLVITSSSFDGVILKAMAYGTFADGELA